MISPDPFDFDSATDAEDQVSEVADEASSLASYSFQHSPRAGVGKAISEDEYSVYASDFEDGSPPSSPLSPLSVLFVNETAGTMSNNKKNKWNNNSSSTNVLDQVALRGSSPRGGTGIHRNTDDQQRDKNRALSPTYQRTVQSPVHSEASGEHYGHDFEDEEDEEGEAETEEQSTAAYKNNNINCEVTRLSPSSHRSSIQQRRTHHSHMSSTNQLEPPNEHDEEEEGEQGDSSASKVETAADWLMQNTSQDGNDDVDDAASDSIYDFDADHVEHDDEIQIESEGEGHSLIVESKENDIQPPEQFTNFGVERRLQTSTTPYALDNTQKEKIPVTDASGADIFLQQPYTSTSSDSGNNIDGVPHAWLATDTTHAFSGNDWLNEPVSPNEEDLRYPWQQSTHTTTVSNNTRRKTNNCPHVNAQFGSTPRFATMQQRTNKQPLLSASNTRTSPIYVTRKGKGVRRTGGGSKRSGHVQARTTQHTSRNSTAVRLPQPVRVTPMDSHSSTTLHSQSPSSVLLDKVPLNAHQALNWLEDNASASGPRWRAHQPNNTTPSSSSHVKYSGLDATATSILPDTAPDLLFLILKSAVRQHNNTTQHGQARSKSRLVVSTAVAGTPAPTRQAQHVRQRARAAAVSARHSAKDVDLFSCAFTALLHHIDSMENSPASKPMRNATSSSVHEKATEKSEKALVSVVKELLLDSEVHYLLKERYFMQMQANNE